MTVFTKAPPSQHIEKLCPKPTVPPEEADPNELVEPRALSAIPIEMFIIGPKAKHPVRRKQVN